METHNQRLNALGLAKWRVIAHLPSDERYVYSLRVRAGDSEGKHAYQLLASDTEQGRNAGGLVVHAARSEKSFAFEDVHVERAFRGQGLCALMVAAAVRHAMREHGEPDEWMVTIESLQPSAAKACYVRALRENGYECVLAEDENYEPMPLALYGTRRYGSRLPYRMTMTFRKPSPDANAPPSANACDTPADAAYRAGTWTDDELPIASSGKRIF